MPYASEDRGHELDLTERFASTGVAVLRVQTPHKKYREGEDAEEEGDVDRVLGGGGEGGGGGNVCV